MEFTNTHLTKRSPSFLSRLAIGTPFLLPTAQGGVSLGPTIRVEAPTWSQGREDALRGWRNNLFPT